ncbi:MAG TPA: ABC transporter permease subunit [Clostridia bacterium]|nr:ABC transporter permease subunit [Clostridia bacterium]
MTINIKRNSVLKHFQRYGALYIMLIIPMAILVLFKYVPMYGAQIAFRNYRITRSIESSPWVGFKYFEKFFDYYGFWPILRNTLTINLYSLLVFPLPLILAILLTHLPFKRMVKTVQNVSYIPHFVSTVVLCSMVIQFTNARTGLINAITAIFGAEPVNFMAHKEYFYPIYILSDLWRDLGYNSIIYIAALTGVSPDLHEAAIMDGASIIKRVWHIDIPSIMPTFCTLLIMRCGQMLTIGYEKVLLLQNSLNISLSEVISTYSYDISLNAASPQFSYAAAIGLFSAVVNLVLLATVNKLIGRTSGNSLW